MKTGSSCDECSGLQCLVTLLSVMRTLCMRTWMEDCTPELQNHTTGGHEWTLCERTGIEYYVWEHGCNTSPENMNGTLPKNRYRAVCMRTWVEHCEWEHALLYHGWFVLYDTSLNGAVYQISPEGGNPVAGFTVWQPHCWWVTAMCGSHPSLEASTLLNFLSSFEDFCRFMPKWCELCHMHFIFSYFAVP